MKYQDLNIDQKINYKHNLLSRSKFVGQPNGWFLMKSPSILKSIGEVYMYQERRKYIAIDCSPSGLPGVLNSVRC